MGKSVAMLVSSWVLGLVAACSPTTSTGGNSALESCSMSTNGVVTSCVTYSNIPAAYVGAVCLSGSVHAAGACTTTNEAGSCTMTESEGTLSLTSVLTTYKVNGATCDTAKAACAAAASSSNGITTTTTFTGNGC